MSIALKLQEIQKKINSAEKKSGRLPGSTTLIAVTKTKSMEVLRQAIKAGLIHFGENYVQEALKKKDQSAS